MIRADAIPGSAKEVAKYIKDYEATASHYISLNEQFKGNQNILSKTVEAGRPDNMLVNSYPSYISTVNIVTGKQIGRAHV